MTKKEKQLFTAIRMRSTDVAYDLINKNYELVEACDADGTSIMTCAIEAGNLTIVELLLENHAEVTNEDMNIAAQKGFKQILRALEKDAGYLYESDSDSEYDKASVVSEDSSNEEKSINSETNNLLSSLNYTSNDDVLRSFSAPAVLQVSPFVLRNSHPTFGRVYSDSFVDNIGRQLEKANQPSETHWSK